MREDEQEAARLRAYHIWEREGRPEGQHESHWQQALMELGLVQPYDPAVAPPPSSWDDDEG